MHSDNSSLDGTFVSYRMLNLPPGPPRGGAGGTMTHEGAHELERGPIEIALSNKRNHLISAGKPVEISVKTFFFGDRLISAGETVEISVKTFFFGDH